ncbi:MAG: hypothetical protein O7H39_11310 [Gammaproteobacteria bacterium]|nr:hypothetical protein [Gammaproteobacteria bacterium]
MPTPTDKRRERSAIVGWIISHPQTTLALCGLALLAAVAGAFHTTVDRRLQRRIAVIRAKGEPITIDDLRALTPVIPDDENMTLRLAEIGVELAAPDDKEGRHEMLCYFPRRRRLVMTGTRLSAEQLDAARWFLETNAVPIAGIHEALELEDGCFKPVWTSPAASMVIPGIASLRGVACALATEQQVATQEGDAQHATWLLFELLHLDNALRHETVMIGLLIRIVNRSAAMDRIERTVNLCGVEAKSLRLMESQLKRMESDLDFHQAVVVERAIVLDSIEWIRSGGNSATIFGGGRVGTSLAAWRHIPIVPALDAAYGLEMLTDLVNGLHTPDAQSIKHCKTIDARISGASWYEAMSRLLIPSLSRAVELWVRQTASARALRTALACERYRLSTGQWPDNLTALLPDYLDALPTDPFDGQTIRFERIEQGVKIWSIGEDQTDDGGNVGRLDANTNPIRTPDAGWILLDPGRRGRPGADNTAP